MAQNTSKNRKSKSQETFEQADNAGRFAGNDTDSQAARQQATENIRQDTQSSRNERDKSDNTDAEARRDGAQSHDYKGEAQNVNDDTGRTLNEQEANHERNKADEGLKQQGNNTK